MDFFLSLEVPSLALDFSQAEGFVSSFFAALATLWRA
jgi:hypothetical protein